MEHSAEPYDPFSRDLSSCTHSSKVRRKGVVLLSNKRYKHASIYVASIKKKNKITIASALKIFQYQMTKGVLSILVTVTNQITNLHVSNCQIVLYNSVTNAGLKCLSQLNYTAQIGDLKKMMIWFWYLYFWFVFNNALHIHFRKHINENDFIIHVH